MKPVGAPPQREFRCRHMPFSDPTSRRSHSQMPSSEDSWQASKLSSVKELRTPYHIANGRDMLSEVRARRPFVRLLLYFVSTVTPFLLQGIQLGSQVRLTCWDSVIHVFEDDNGKPWTRCLGCRSSISPLHSLRWCTSLEAYQSRILFSHAAPGKQPLIPYLYRETE